MEFHPFRNLGLKVLAVGLATLLWLTVLGEHVVERSMRIPLQFRNIPEALEIVGNPPGDVEVRVRGSSGLLSRLQPGEIVAVLELRTARPGARLFYLRTDQVQAPYGVEIAQVLPATVALQIEKTGVLMVPVVPAVEGDPAPGYVMGAVQIDPARVQVVGPESRLRELSKAITEPVSIENARATVHDVVTIGVLDSALRLSAQQSASVTVEIRPAPLTRVLASVPVRLRNLDDGLRAQVVPATVTASVRGQHAPLADLGADAVIVFVDLAGLGPGQYNLPVRVDPPSAFGVTGLEPATVAVRIQ